MSYTELSRVDNTTINESIPVILSDSEGSYVLKTQILRSYLPQDDTATISSFHSNVSATERQKNNIRALLLCAQH